jgi:hypothetical protein
MALLLKESSDLISAYHHQHHFRHHHHHHHPMPATFHHSLSSPTNPSLMHPTPKYPLDLRTSIIEQQQQQPFDAHESAARILFSAINWAKTVPAFVSLSNHDQVKIAHERIESYCFFSFTAFITRRRLARFIYSNCCRTTIFIKSNRFTC